VRIRAVKLLGVPKGLEVIGVYAVRAEGGILGSGTRFNRAALHPVTDASFDPGKPERWYFLANIRARRPGSYLTKAVDVSWTAGHRRGHTTFNYGIGIKVRA
jgi:hypothetical protein